MKKENILMMEEEEHKKYHTRLLYVFIIILIVLFGGSIFYHYAERWKYLDAFYFSASTITTVGYGDITPKTDSGKLFTIFYLFTGVGIAVYGLSLMASHFVEVREEFWIQRLAKLKMRPSGFFMKKIKNFFNYEPGGLTQDYDKYNRSKK